MSQRVSEILEIIQRANISPISPAHEEIIESLIPHAINGSSRILKELNAIMEYPTLFYSIYDQFTHKKRDYVRGVIGHAYGQEVMMMNESAIRPYLKPRLNWLYINHDSYIVAKRCFMKEIFDEIDDADLTFSSGQTAGGIYYEETVSIPESSLFQNKDIDIILPFFQYIGYSNRNFIFTMDKAIPDEAFFKQIIMQLLSAETTVVLDFQVYFYDTLADRMFNRDPIKKAIFNYYCQARREDIGS